MNAHAERLNRTVQQEFIEFHQDLLLQDINAFNESRPHYALGLQAPSLEHQDFIREVNPDGHHFLYARAVQNEQLAAPLFGNDEWR